MQVLSWNLFHGRTVPESRSAQLDAFAAALAGWAWDVALLQEVPPWWPGPLARACDADGRAVLTSRNFGLAARRWVAERRPDVIKSNGGGANAILVRRSFGVVGRHATRRLCWWPERRWLHAVEVGGVWVGNVHASTRDDRARRELRACAAALEAWSGGGGASLLLGGDANTAERGIVDGWADLGGHGIDRFFARGLALSGTPVVLERATLSDHAPVAIEVS